MKIDFNQFNISQKIYSIGGLVTSIIVYMADKDNVNISIGLALLTAIAVFLLNYKKVQWVLNLLATICIAIVASLVVNRHFQNKDYEKQIAQKESYGAGGSYYAVVREKLPGTYGVTTELVVKCSSDEACQGDLKAHTGDSSNPNIVFAECTGDDGTYQRIFNHKPMSDWYVAWDLKDRNPRATIIKYSNFIAKMLNKDFAATHAMVLAKSMKSNIEKSGATVDIKVISPDGEVVIN